ncbi:MAG: Ig-like domain-containing protein [bacterium]|nr:Ig-like domain-containing protein [bacterium]
MGRTKKLYQVRRILALILAVAMSVTMIPATAIAAPADGVADEGAAVSTTSTETPDDVDGDAVDADAGTDAGEGVTTDTTNTAADTAVDTGDDADAADTTNPTADEPAAPAASKPVYEILTDNMETTVVYTGSFPFNLYSIVLKKTQDGSTTETPNAVGRGDVTASWKKQGAAAAMTTDPVDVGVYELTLTYAKVEGEHDGAEATVTCEITKAPVTIVINGYNDASRITVKPGTAAKDVKLTDADTVDVYAAGGNVGAEYITLEITGVRNAITGEAVGGDEKLARNGDYVADIKPSWKANLPAEDQARCANYELPESFTADIEAADLVETQIEVKLADKWKTAEDPAGTVVLKSYKENEPADAPKETDDYTYEVQYWDDTTGEYKKLADAAAAGEWAEYDGCEKDSDGKVKAPTNAGDYTYVLVYEDADSVYDTAVAYIPVRITPAVLKVEAANTAALEVLEGTTAQEVLAQVKYKVTLDEADVTTKMKGGSVWGTGFDDSNVSQIYEPLFTLQVSADNGTTYETVTDKDYALEGSAGKKKYRVIYDGKKAIYNADGSYAHVTDVNDRANINGVDANYETDTTPTAADKALEVTVTDGTEVTVDLSALLGDKAGAKTIADLTAKVYDGNPIYRVRNDYKSKVKLLGKDGADAGITPSLRALDCAWYQYRQYDDIDLLDAQIEDENQRNGFGGYYDPADDNYWTALNATTIAPKDAGVYKLVVTYTGQKTDGKLYYAKEPAVMYYAIDPRQIKVEPTGEYKVLEGRNGYDLLDKRHDSSTYTLTCENAEGDAIVAGENVEPFWQVIETRTQEGSANPVTYGCWESGDFNFEFNEKVTYELQGSGLGFDVYGEEDIISYDGFTIADNYTCFKPAGTEEVGEANAEGKKRVERKEDTFLNTKASITVAKMGEKKLTVAFDADAWGTKEKVYDAKAYTDTELIGSAVTVTDETGAAITGDAPDIRYEGYIGTDGYGETKEIRDVGTYTVYAFFDGSEKYAPLKSPAEPSDPWNPDEWGVKLGTFTITPRPITLKAVLSDTYTAGVYASSVLNAMKGSITVDGKADDDAWAFTEYYDDDYDEYFMEAWSEEGHGNKYDPEFVIYEKGAKNPISYTRLKRDTEYEVRYDEDGDYMRRFYRWDNNAGDYNYDAPDYTVSQESVAEFKVVPGNSGISSRSYTTNGSSIDSIAIKTKNDAADSMKRTVTMQEGIGFSSAAYYDENGERVSLEGNLAAFRITPPAEYNGSMPETAMYRNEIAKIGGHIVSDISSGFTVIFDAREGDKTFPIRWEDGYVETYTLKFKDAVKLGDLNNAVAPKSLAFNAPEKKMAVGSSQQLDVKITKVQMSDVICLGYKSSDESVLHVNENGYVTALKIGKANITVFPQHKVNGKLVKIDNAKEVSLQITTTKVTAPKKVKVTTHGSGDADANLSYDTPKDGYRREIYVVNSKSSSLKKAADFEKKLAGTSEDSWKENQWQGTFAIAPIYVDSADEALNRRRNGYAAQLKGLGTNGTYTIYVRNVCAARTLTGGSEVTNDAVNASAAGTVVSLKTLKSEQLSLRLELDAQEGITGGGYKEDGIWQYDNHYEIDLSKIKKGIVTSTTYGQFYTMPKDDAAQSDDTEWIKLPLSAKTDKDAYENPKLEYTLAGCWNSKTQRYEYGTKNNIASIDKKGKIKITGMTVMNDDDSDRNLIVRVRDLQTNGMAYAYLRIVAQADSVAAAKKNVTLTVGETLYLNEQGLLSYKMGKQKLTNYYYPDIDIAAVKAAIKDQKQEKFFKLEDDRLTAIAGGGSLKLPLTDRTVARESGKDKATATITVKSKDLTAVKKIKAFDVTNEQFGLTFTYAGGADAFLLEISDAANKTIYSQKLWRDSDAYRIYFDSNHKRVKDTYRIDSRQITNYVKLAKETQYTVKITALYDALAAKPATAKVKTTKIPAVGDYLHDDYDEDYEYSTGKLISKEYGGMSIVVGEYGDEEKGTKTRKLQENYEYDDDDNLVGAPSLNILSGNSYTLTAETWSNRGRISDTLVWTVDNAKVATVKAAAGTYSITMKGVKPGNTTLEVKSKILGNKVIARYRIYVTAVGDAYKNANRYYGDNEPEEFTGASLNNGNNIIYLPLSVGDARKVTADQTTYFSFTAPESGKYAVSAGGGSEEPSIWAPQATEAIGISAG